MRTVLKLFIIIGCVFLASCQEEEVRPEFPMQSSGYGEGDENPPPKPIES